MIKCINDRRVIVDTFKRESKKKGGGGGKKSWRRVNEEPICFPSVASWVKSSHLLILSFRETLIFTTIRIDHIIGLQFSQIAQVCNQLALTCMRTFCIQTMWTPCISCLLFLPLRRVKVLSFHLKVDHRRKSWKSLVSGDQPKPCAWHS